MKTVADLVALEEDIAAEFNSAKLYETPVLVLPSKPDG